MKLLVRLCSSAAVEVAINFKRNYLSNPNILPSIAFSGIRNITAMKSSKLNTIFITLYLLGMEFFDDNDGRYYPKYVSFDHTTLLK
jgi:hypothetical protein